MALYPGCYKVADFSFCFNQSANILSLFKSWRKCAIARVIYSKSFIEPKGAYLFFGVLKGELNREGGLVLT